jgi:hypothetical protein
LDLVSSYGLEMLIQQAGSALAIKTWAWQLTEGKGQPLPSEKPYPNEASLIESVKKVLETGKQKAGRSPKVLVIGAVSLFSNRRVKHHTDYFQARTMWQRCRAIRKGRRYS